VWAGACAGKPLGLRGGLECSDLDYLRSALDGKRGALEREPTKHVRTHTHKLKPLNHFTVVPHPLSPLRFNSLWPSRHLGPPANDTRMVYRVTVVQVFVVRVAVGVGARALR